MKNRNYAKSNRINAVPLPKITEEDKYKALKFKAGDKLKAKFFIGHHH